MNVGWLLDASVFDAYHDELVAAIVRNGFLVKSVHRPKPPYSWDNARAVYRKAFPQGSCVVTHADIDLVSRVMSDNRWTPGGFATVAHFYCSRYYPHLDQYLLNRDHLILPFCDLASRSNELFDKYGRDGRIFVRPDSPLKLFTGLVVARDTLEKDLEYMAFFEFPAEAPVIISSPKAIAGEWRFIIADRQVVASSKYKNGEQLIAEPGAEDGAQALAERIAGDDFSPDPVWVLDVCKTADGAFHLLEIGGFSFSNLYACDKDAVVRAVSRVALRGYDERR